MKTNQTAKDPTYSTSITARLARQAASHPIPILIGAVVLAVLSIVYTVVNLDFKTSRNDLVADKERAVQLFDDISDDFGRVTNTIVVVEGYDLDKMKGFISDLAAILEKEPEYFDNLFYRIDTSSLDGKKLLYLSPKEVAELKDKLVDYQDLIEELAFSPEIRNIFAFVNQKVSEATVSHLVASLLGGNGTTSGPEKVPDTPGGTGHPGANPGPDDPNGGQDSSGEDPVDLSFLRSLLTEMKLALEPNYRFTSPWDTFFETSSKFSEDGFLVSDDHRFAFMVLNARSQQGTFTKKRASLERLRNHVNTLRAERYPELKAGVTGGSALATDEMSQAMKDTTWATLLALVAVGVLFMVVFHQVYNPLTVVISLVLAMCWTFGWLTLTVGHLTILSVAFTPILLGLGVDFGIHVLARYNEERWLGKDAVAALDESYRHTGKAITAGGVTTAVAFFAVMLADFRGIQELGFIAGSGVLLSLASTFTVLPAMLSLVEKRRGYMVGSRTTLRINLRFLEWAYGKTAWVIGICVVLCVASLVSAGSVMFDYNLLNLQAKGTDSVTWEKKISEDSGRSSWFAVTTADTLEEVQAKKKAFKALPAVKKVNSLADLIPEDQDSRIRAVQALKPVVADYEVNFDVPQTIDVEQILELLEKIKFKLRTDAKWDPEKKPAEVEILATRKVLVELIEVLKKMDLNQVQAHWIPFQDHLFKDFSSKFRLVKDNTDPPGPIREQDVPEELLQRFRGKSGRYLLQIFSRRNIWEKENMAAFANQLHGVDPDVTGPPIVGYIAIDLMRRGYLEGALYALIAIIIVIWLDFRNWRDTVFALVPLVLTTLLVLGWMGFTGLHFNLANLVGLPLVMGIVVDDGIHIMHRYREDPDLVHALVTGSTAQAVTLTSWTTMVGFGSLLIAKHYGVFSMGLLITMAVAFAWVLSLIVLPVILTYRRQRATLERG